MGWWKSLKVWQRSGIVIGAIHVILYFLGVIIFRDFFGYFALLLEYPWGYLYKAVFGLPGDMLFFPFDLLIGTTFYAIVGAVAGWIIGQLQKPN